jgi:serine/threonine protein kinase
MTETNSPGPSLSVGAEVAGSPSTADYDSLDETVRIGDPHPLVLGPHLPAWLDELGSYRLRRRLGAGGMGIVFEAEDQITGERFALKILRPTLASDPDSKLRFFHEAHALAAVGHQRIVPIVRVGEEHSIPFIVMPLLRGETLDARLARDEIFRAAEIVRIGAEIAEGLDAAHQQGLVHRDVKPANIFLEEPDASVRLLDLGIAREVTRDTLVSSSGILVGTPAYMAPEQARGERPDPRSDLFSLGCILYQMATGERPFDGPTPLAALGRLEKHHPPRVTALNSSIPAPLSNLIMEMLAKQPDDRPETAREVTHRLSRIHINTPPPAPCLVVAPAAAPEVIALSDESEPFQGSRLFLLSFLGLLAAAAGVWYFIGR